MNNNTLYSAGQRIQVRGEDFKILKVEHECILHCLGVSELVRNKKFIFNSLIDSENISAIKPENTEFILDEDPRSIFKLNVETALRTNHLCSDDKILIADKCACDKQEYQFEPFLKSLKLFRPRLLIADGVGLGKTIEVGIILSEMIKRGRGTRILICTLKSILSQFQEEMWTRFAIPFIRLDSVGIERIKSEIPVNLNPFEYYDKTIISIDTLKNSGKFRAYIDKTHWDIIVIDECHIVTNRSSDRGELAQKLAEKCDSLILTSATPHNGKKEAFANIVNMLDPIAIPLVLNSKYDYTKKDIEQYFIRRLKNDLDSSVKENFSERNICNETYKLNHLEYQFLKLQHSLKIKNLKALEDNKKNKNDDLFAITVFKAFLSSPAAATQTLKNRIQKIEEKSKLTDNSLITDDYEELKELLSISEQINKENDSRYATFKKVLIDINWKEKQDRIVIFTERKETMKYLQNNICKDHFDEDVDKNDSVVLFDGSLSDVQQEEIIDKFRLKDSSIKILICSDAGSMGVNLHDYCHIMINYDIPWSIITLQQRNGRIDRYGQKYGVQIYYLLVDEFENDTDQLNTDLRIITKLKSKEEEISKTIGKDANDIFHDAKEEEKNTKYAILEGNEHFLDESNNEEDDDAFFDLFSSSNDSCKEDIFAHNSSLFHSDYDFIDNLKGFLLNKSLLKEGDVNLTKFDDDIFELKINENDDLKDIVFDFPIEARPSDGVYSLTNNKEKINRCITDSYQKKYRNINEFQKTKWAKEQILYDGHPIIAYLYNKFTASLGRNQAPVAKFYRGNDNTFYYVVYASIANKLGINILSDFYAIELGNDGNCSGIITLNEFIEKHPEIKEKNFAVSEDEIKFAQENIQLALEFCILKYRQKQSKKSEELDSNLKKYKEKIDQWVSNSKNNLNCNFDESNIENNANNNHQPIWLKRKEEVINNTQSYINEVAENIYQLENAEPFFQVLGCAIVKKFSETKNSNRGDL